CHEARSLHESCIGGADQDFAPDEQFSAEEHCLLRSVQNTALHQAALMRPSASNCERPRIYLPEVLNMLFVILRRVFPNCELWYGSPVARIVRRLICLSTSVVYAVARPPQTDGYEYVWDEDELEESMSSSPEASLRFRKYKPIGDDRQLLYTGDARSQGPTLACVDLADGVTSLLTSALFHRQAMGALGPLIGISVQKTSPIVHIRIAWLDEWVAEDNDLASKLLYYAAIDLRDPMATCRLALFLHRAACANDEHDFCAQDVHRWQWRADLEEEAMLSHTDCSRGDRIEIWAAEVYKETMGRRHQTARGSSNTAVDESADKAPNLRRGLRDRSSSASSEGVQRPPPNQYDGSYVLQKTERGIPQTQRYFATRGVVFCSARHGWAPWAGVPKEYMYSTSLLWFRQGSATPIFKNICTEQQKLVAELVEAHTRNSHSVLGYMTDAVQKVVEHSLCAVLQVVQMARLLDATKDIVIKGEDVRARQVRNEATYRHQWDQLFHLVVTNSGLSDIGYEREASLRYPEYVAPVSDDSATSTNLSRMFSAVHPYAVADSKAMERFEYWRKGLEDPTNPRTEPLRGVADGILYLTVSDAFRTKTVAESVSIWTPNIVVAGEEPDIDAVFDDGTGPPRYAANAFAWGKDRAPVSEADRLAYQASTGRTAEKPKANDARTTATGQDPLPRSDAPSTCTHSHDPSPKSTTHVKTTNLYIPLIACEYKRLLKLWTAGAATDQERLYLVAICIFIRLFNLRFPVFGLVTSGPRGVISCAWNELIHVRTPFPKDGKTTEFIDEHTPAIFIADQEAMQVDLRDPLDALNVATFIAYLMVVHAPRLRKLFESTAHVDDSVAEYLLYDDKPAPLQMARNLRDGDKKWRKAGSTRPRSKAARVAEGAVGSGVKRRKAMSAGSMQTSDLEVVPEEEHAE
ncbi:hypothetical protein HDZ31DRAFT_45373, partial [Schizophyllum fasciatum]